MPIIADRTRMEILSSLLQNLPGYVPGWQLENPSSGRMMMQVFARYLEILSEGVSQVPDRSLMAFLATLGTQLLPAQAAQAPLIFTLMDNTPVDLTLPAGSQVAAPARPIAPSPLKTDRKDVAPKDAIFSTLQTVTLTRARLATLYSINPGSDEFAEHTPDLTRGFTLFDNMRLTEHAIYLGHDELFALGGENVVVMLSFSLERFASRELKTEWEYLTEGGWSPLESVAQDETTGGMRHDGLIMLRRECAPKARQDTIEGRTSYWLRGRLTSPLLPDGGNGERTVPIINDIRARVGFRRSGIVPEAAYMDAVPLDISKDFYPFGQQPTTYTTFYLACKEVFQRKGATVRMDIDLRQSGQIGNLRKVVWEYFDGNAWATLSINPSGYDFASPGISTSTPTATVSFDCPQKWTETSVNGESNYWLRVRVINGDYGSPAKANINFVPAQSINDVTASKITVGSNQEFSGGEYVILIKETERMTTYVSGREGTNILILKENIPATYKDGTIIAPPFIPGDIRSPIISKIAFAFTYLTDPFELDHCLSNNDFVFEDHTEDCRWPDRTFTPFQTVADTQPAIHFGFDKRPPIGLISMYANVQDESDDTSKGSPFVWEYRSERGWTELGVLDETLGFQRSGMIQFIGQPDAVAALGLGGNLFHMRARLKQGESILPLLVSGMWLNAIPSAQRGPREREELGISDGNPGQTFTLRRKPVLAGESIEIQEWVGNGEGWRTTLDDVPESDRRLVRDTVSQKVTSVWVTWRSQTHLYNSSANDRHYTIERATGLIRFGDSHNGLMPRAGSRIVAIYSSGGGMAGNVPANAITELRSAMPYIQSATNPVPASGGAEIESNDAVKRRGPQRLRNHDRSVSAEDCEWLAREASPDVARVRCLPITGPAGHAQRGWITLVVVPISPEAQPQPSPEFRRRVRDYLAKRVPFAVARHVKIIPAQYTLVGVKAEVIPHTAEQAAQVEAQVRKNLNRFLHPLDGGADGLGWAFGQAVYLSQIARVIEETVGVDYAREIRLQANGQVFADVVPIAVNTLVAAGDHELRLSIGID